MPFNYALGKFKKHRSDAPVRFIKKESVYLLMLSFIFLFNLSLVWAQKVPGMKEGFAGRRIFGFQLLKEDVEEDNYNIPQIDEQAFREKLSQQQLQLPLLLTASFFIIVLMLGLYLDIRILIAGLKKREILKRANYHLRVRWGVGDIFRLAIIFVFLRCISHIIEVNILSFLSETETPPVFISLLHAGMLSLLLLGLTVYFIRVKYSQELTGLGFKLKSAGRNILLAILGYIAFLPILFLLCLILIIIASAFNYLPPSQPILKLFSQDQRLWYLICATLFVVLLGPVVEEIFFRGFVYNALKKSWGVSWAMVLTAAVFAALHQSLFGFLPIMALGLLLSLMYEKTGSLIPSITMHVLHNSLMIGFLFLGKYFGCSIQ